MQTSTPAPTPLAKHLSRLRLRQVDLAAGLGVSAVTVSLWVHGRAQPSGLNLVRIARWLREYDSTVTAEDLVDLEVRRAAS